MKTKEPMWPEALLWIPALKSAGIFLKPPQPLGFNNPSPGKIPRYQRKGNVN